MPHFDTTDGVTLFYRDWGTGPPAVLVPSWSLSSLMWQYQMAYLDDHGVRCVAYDRRGHGRSDDPGCGFDYDTLADDLAALIEHLHLQEVTLVGHSMGGAEIVRYLTRHGAGRVARIALVAAALPFMLRTEDNPEGMEPSDAEAARDAWRRDLPLGLAEIAPPFFGDGVAGCSVSPELQEWLLDDAGRSSLKAVLDCSRAITATDFRQEMPAISVPTLVIHGDADVSLPLELSGAKSAQLIPGSRLEVYENAPHGLFLTHMARLSSDLLGFITG